MSVHEQVHVWPQTYGKPSKNGYHNKQWVAKMKEIGLQPSHNGQQGGKETGSHMTHYILKCAAYAKAYAKLKARGFTVRQIRARQDLEQKEIHLPEMRSQRLGQARCRPQFAASATKKILT